MGQNRARLVLVVENGVKKHQTGVFFSLVFIRTCWRTHQWVTRTACPCRWPWPNWRLWLRSSMKRREKPTSAARSVTSQRPWTSATSTRSARFCAEPKVYWSVETLLLADLFFSICCGISLSPSVGGHQTLELLSWLNTLFLVHGLAQRLHKNTSFPQGIIIRLSSATHSGICAQACLQDGLDGAGCEFPVAWIFSESLHYSYPKWEDARVKWAINAKWNTRTLSLCLFCIPSPSWVFV